MAFTKIHDAFTPQIMKVQQQAKHFSDLAKTLKDQQRQQMLATLTPHQKTLLVKIGK